MHVIFQNPTMTTGLDFKSAQFDQVRGEARGLDECEDLKSIVQSELEDLKMK